MVFAFQWTFNLFIEQLTPFVLPPSPGTMFINSLHRLITRGRIHTLGENEKEINQLMTSSEGPPLVGGGGSHTGLRLTIPFFPKNECIMKLFALLPALFLQKEETLFKRKLFMSFRN